jgi:cytochrome P450
VMVMPGAANRDERRFEAPAEFRLDHQNAREHNRVRPRFPCLTLPSAMKRRSCCGA